MRSTKSPGALYAELGNGLFQAGRYEDAAEALNKALAEEAADFPRSETYLTLGKIYGSANKHKEALEALSEAVRLDPNVINEAEKYITKIQEGLGATQTGGSGLFNFIKGFFSLKVQPIIRKIALELFAKEKFPEVEQLLRILLLTSPDDADLQELLGQSLLRQKRAVESIDVFSKAADLNKERPSAYLGLGEAYSLLELYPEAADALKRSLELKPDDSSAMLLQGTVLRNLGDLESSERTLRRVVELQPDNHVAYCEIAATLRQANRPADAAVATTEAARIMFEKSDYKAAERLLKDAITLDPESGPSYLELGRARIALQQYDEAVAALTEAANRNLAAKANTEKARARFYQENFSDALEAIDNAIGQAPAGSAELAEATGLRGVILFRLGDLSAATRMLDTALSYNPNHPWFQVERGAIFEANGETEPAVAAYHRAIEADPSNRWAHKQLGLLFLQQKRYKEAAASLQQAVKLFPEALSYIKMGEALVQIAQNDEAITALDKALEHDPANSDASYYRGRALFNLKRYQEAVAAFQLAIDLNLAEGKDEHELAAVYAEMGEALRLANRIQEAKSAFKKAISARPDYQWALARYGETLRVLEKNLEAVESLQQAVALKEDDGWAWGALGAAKVALKKYRSALEALEKAVKYDSESSFNWGYLGALLRLVKRYEPAIEAFNRALALESNTGWIFVEKGIALREMKGDGCAEALLPLERATELEPDAGHTWCQLADCLYRLGRYKEALKNAEKGLTLDPTLKWALILKSLVLDALQRTDEAQQAQALGDSSDPTAYFERGLNYMELGAYDKAARDFEASLQLKPEYADAANNLAWLYIVRPEPDLEKATALALDAASMAPEDANVQDTLGWAYFKRGMLDEAIESLELAARLESEDLQIQDHLEACRKEVSQRTIAESRSTPAP